MIKPARNNLRAELMELAKKQGHDVDKVRLKCSRCGCEFFHSKSGWFISRKLKMEGYVWEKEVREDIKSITCDGLVIEGIIR